MQSYEKKTNTQIANPLRTNNRLQPQMQLFQIRRKRSLHFFGDNLRHLLHFFGDKVLSNFYAGVTNKHLLDRSNCSKTSAFRPPLSMVDVET